MNEQVDPAARDDEAPSLFTLDGPIDYRAAFPELGIDPAEVPAVVAASDTSWAKIDAARRQLARLHAPGLACFALGSVGRLESSAISDLDLAVVQVDPSRDAAACERDRDDVIASLRALGLDVHQKTFDRVVRLDAIVRDVGGRHDSNDHLTYRALLLTEGAWLLGEGACSQALRTLFEVYSRGRISRGRSLSSLDNDLQRYYRTLCVDYRFKVEEAHKQWAVRNLKLRHSRKLWRLANLSLFCAAAAQPERTRVRWIAARLGAPPLWRIIEVLRGLDGSGLCGPLVRAFDPFLDALARPETRRALDELAHERRWQSPIYQSLHENGERLEAAAHAVVDHLWTRCHDHLLRFGVL
ncbi:MAG: hypothetical protein R3A51_01065 [Nannocystaceae bacterium]